MMRVGLITYGIERHLSGIGHYTVELVKALLDVPQPVEITILHAGGAGDFVHLPVKLIPLKYASRIPALWTIGAWQIRQIVQREKFDILHDMTGLAPLWLGKSPTPVILTLYDLIPIQLPKYSNPVDRFNFRWRLPRIVHQKVDAIVTISDYSRRELEAYFQQTAHNISAGISKHYQPVSPKQVEAVRQKYRLPPEYLLFVGAMVERKNIQRILAAFQQVMRVFPNYQLVLGGAKNWRFRLVEAWVDELQLQDNVIFAGYVDEDDLPAVYSGAEIFLFPSLYEGFGLPILEAMACGTPVVTSNRSSLPEIAGTAAKIINPLDVAELVDAIIHLLESSEMLLNMQKNGLQQAQHFSWEITAQHLLNIYQDVSHHAQS